MATIAFRVDDMNCSHCVGVITRALKAADPNAAVRIDLAAHRVEVDPDAADAKVLGAAIEDAGYTPVPVGG